MCVRERGSERSCVWVVLSGCEKERERSFDRSFEREIERNYVRRTKQHGFRAVLNSPIGQGGLCVVVAIGLLPSFDKTPKILNVLSEFPTLSGHHSIEMLLSIRWEFQS